MGISLSRLKTYASCYSLVFALIFIYIVPALAGHANEAPASLRIHRAEISSYPQIDLELGLSSKGRLASFKLSENGRDIDKITVRSLDEKIPVAITLLIDVSGSMAGQRLIDAKNAANWFVKHTGEGDKISIVTFSSNVQKITSFTDDKLTLHKAINDLQAKGETSVYDALAFSLAEMRKQSIGKASIILLSDGGDTASRLSARNIAEMVKSKDVPIQAIAFKSSESNPQILKDISLTSGGQAFDARDSKSLNQLYGNLASDINNRYTISYESAAKGRLQIDISAKDQAGGKTYGISTTVDTGTNVEVPVSDLAKPVTMNVTAPSRPLAIGFLSFMAIFLLVMALSGLFSSSNVLAEQLSYYDRLQSSRQQGRNSSHGEIKLKGLFIKITEFFTKRILSTYGFTEFAKKRLEQAGLSMKPNEYMVAHILAVTIITFLVRMTTENIFLILLTVTLCVVLPLLVIQILTSKRRARFNEQLPETLDFIANSMRVGIGLNQALIICVKEMDRPMSDEINKINKKVEFGDTLIDALTNAALEIDNENFDLAVVGLTIQQETGGNLSEIFSNIAGNLREKETLKRQINVLTSEGRLSATVLIALPFVQGAAMFVINPEYVSVLFNSSSGLLMLGAALLLIIMGSLWLVKIVNLEEY